MEGDLDGFLLKFSFGSSFKYGVDCEGALSKMRETGKDVNCRERLVIVLILIRSLLLCQKLFCGRSL